MTGGKRTYRLNNVVDQLFGLVNLLLGVGHNEAVKILLLVAGVSSVRTALAFLDGALATDGNLGAGVVFHLLECVSTGSDK